MKTSESVQALRRANPRTRAGFAQLVDATAEAVGAQLATAVADVAMDAGARGHGPEDPKCGAAQVSRLPV